MFVADDPEQAWSRVAPHFEYHLDSYAHYGAEGTTGDDDIGSGSIDQMSTGSKAEDFRSKGPVMQAPAFDVVTADEAIARVRAWCGPLPALEGLFFDSIAGMPEDLIQRNIELLATKVAPGIATVGIDTSSELAESAPTG
jgi:hypothetical protein